MRTEFLIPFELDTTAVEDKLNNTAYNEVVGKLFEELKASLPKTYGKVDWTRVMFSAINEFFESHADEIIDTTVLLLAQKVGNRKRWREALKEIKDQEKGGPDSE